MYRLNLIGDVVLQILHKHGTRADVNELLEELLVAEEDGRRIGPVARLGRAHPRVQPLQLQRVVERADVLGPLQLTVLVVDEHLVVLADQDELLLEELDELQEMCRVLFERDQEANLKDRS